MWLEYPSVHPDEVVLRVKRTPGHLCTGLTSAPRSVSHRPPLMKRSKSLTQPGSIALKRNASTPDLTMIRKELQDIVYGPPGQVYTGSLGTYSRELSSLTPIRGDRIAGHKAVGGTTQKSHQLTEGSMIWLNTLNQLVQSAGDIDIDSALQNEMVDVLQLWPAYIRQLYSGESSSALEEALHATGRYIGVIEHANRLMHGSLQYMHFLKTFLSNTNLQVLLLALTNLSLVSDYTVLILGYLIRLFSLDPRAIHFRPLRRVLRELCLQFIIPLFGRLATTTSVDRCFNSKNAGLEHLTIIARFLLLQVAIGTVTLYETQLLQRADSYLATLALREITPLSKAVSIGMAEVKAGFLGGVFAGAIYDVPDTNDGLPNTFLQRTATLEVQQMRTYADLHRELMTSQQPTVGKRPEGYVRRMTITINVAHNLDRSLYFIAWRSTTVKRLAPIEDLVKMYDHIHACIQALDDFEAPQSVVPPCPPPKPPTSTTISDEPTVSSINTANIRRKRFAPQRTTTDDEGSDSPSIFASDPPVPHSKSNPTDESTTSSMKRPDDPHLLLSQTISTLAGLNYQTSGTNMIQNYRAGLVDTAAELYDNVDLNLSGSLSRLVLHCNVLKNGRRKRPALKKPYLMRPGLSGISKDDPEGIMALISANIVSISRELQEGKMPSQANALMLSRSLPLSSRSNTLRETAKFSAIGRNVLHEIEESTQKLGAKLDVALLEAAQIGNSTKDISQEPLTQMTVSPQRDRFMFPLHVAQLPATGSFSWSFETWDSCSPLFYMVISTLEKVSIRTLNTATWSELAAFHPPEAEPVLTDVTIRPWDRTIDNPPEKSFSAPKIFLRQRHLEEYDERRFEADLEAYIKQYQYAEGRDVTRGENSGKDEEKEEIDEFDLDTFLTHARIARHKEKDRDNVEGTTLIVGANSKVRRHLVRDARGELRYISPENDVLVYYDIPGRVGRAPADEPMTIEERKYRLVFDKETQRVRRQYSCYEGDRLVEYISESDDGDDTLRTYTTEGGQYWVRMRIKRPQRNGQSESTEDMDVCTDAQKPNTDINAFEVSKTSPAAFSGETCDMLVSLAVSKYVQPLSVFDLAEHLVDRMLEGVENDPKKDFNLVSGLPYFGLSATMIEQLHRQTDVATD
ncbi:hypothetical protein GMRT_13561 [Giardia muris]|uniref:Uncharacterized protein n=1 Tax=Giardia muris TaxID=5742 RepID=A0A4Z1TBT0_GIAMU|nr:hypothetical protein GMRT_13561 [Giardia muris]|eukprot:TNJ29981.1 hypothetical protein GMRT_13561 [Giardia muris]